MDLERYNIKKVYIREISIQDNFIRITDKDKVNIYIIMDKSMKDIGIIITSRDMGPCTF